MKVNREINGIQMSFDLTEDEIIQWVASKSLDERVVFFRKLAKLDQQRYLKNFNPLNLLKSKNK
jgi:hypothetical protein